MELLIAVLIYLGVFSNQDEANAYYQCPEARAHAESFVTSNEAFVTFNQNWEENLASTKPYEWELYVSSNGRPILWEYELW